MTFADIHGQCHKMRRRNRFYAEKVADNNSSVKI
jgi:hypothetical protein